MTPEISLGTAGLESIMGLLIKLGNFIFLTYKKINYSLRIFKRLDTAQSYGIKF